MAGHVRVARGAGRLRRPPRRLKKVLPVPSLAARIENRRRDELDERRAATRRRARRRPRATGKARTTKPPPRRLPRSSRRRDRSASAHPRTRALARRKGAVRRVVRRVVLSAGARLAANPRAPTPLGGGARRRRELHERRRDARRGAGLAERGAAARRARQRRRQHAFAGVAPTPRDRCLPRNASTRPRRAGPASRPARASPPRASRRTQEGAQRAPRGRRRRLGGGVARRRRRRRRAAAARFRRGESVRKTPRGWRRPPALAGSREAPRARLS